MTASRAPQKVFINYTHDSAVHKRRVLELSERLRQDGVDAWIDRYVEGHGPHWPSTELELDSSDLVLVICSEINRKLFDGEAPVDSNKGGKLEAHYIVNQFCDAGSVHTKCVPVLLEGASKGDIPRIFRNWEYYSPTDATGYEKLYRRITGQPAIVRRPLGAFRGLAAEAVELPPLPDRTMEDQTAAYLKRLRQEVGYVKIGSIDPSTTQAIHFPIPKAYVPLYFVDSSSAARQRLESALQHDRVIIQGDAGSGKSTFMKCVAFDLSHEAQGFTPLEPPERRFPLYIRVSELDAHITRMWNRDPRETKDSPTRETDPRWIAHFLGMLDWGATREFFETRLLRDDSVLLLDGLDESPGERGREHMVKLLEESTRRYPNCRIVVTTRPQTLTGETCPEGFGKVSIDRFDERSVNLFVERWCACRYSADPDKAERERTRLSQALRSGEIPELAKNPLMLSALTVIHFNGGGLPDNRLELYEAILRWLAKSRESLPGQPDWGTRLERLRLVALGMQMHEGGRVRQIPLDDAVTLLSPLLSGSEALRCLRMEEADSGILAARADSVEFPHLMFQEFLAAQAFGDKTEPEIYDILWRNLRLFSPEWREVLRFLVAIMRELGQSKPNRLFSAILENTGTSVAERARTVALLTMLKDELRRRAGGGNITEFRVTNPRFEEFAREMVKLFDNPDDGAGLDLRTRADAAEAWERLGDTSRLLLPSDSRYWVNLGRFQIGRYPVTVGEYEKFVQSGGLKPRFWETQQPWPYRPVINVSWHDAIRYCNWVGVRLPTEEEWKLAAGDGHREFPWGDQGPDDERANFGMHVGRVTPVGVLPRGNTQDGVADMAGNVWEWTASDSDGRSDMKVLCGGTFADVARALRSANSIGSREGAWDLSLGFRCVQDSPSGGIATLERSRPYTH